ncbi:Acetyltransferase [Pseudomonas amygdali pv. hibisci]|nr:Acetyltransferase [Pseudomonas amygdali pv. hibisci]KPY81420.1 Acetyltransferase [Pseudomonas amygdali pv. tabaci]RMN54189.1 Acetyltransferase [Pseudomonas amygdali pv. hibisci]RMR90994.1 Acetyltransferase [Pseudomonas amygdali pv. tabaci]
MPDRGRTYGGRPRALIPERAPTQRPNLTDASAGHYWLMRRTLALPVPSAVWPPRVLPRPFTLEQAPEVHRLLTLGHASATGSVPDYPHWRAAFEQDPEFDTSRCFLAMLDETVVGVIVCWTSAFIKDLVVHPDVRHSGIGFALLNHLFAHLSKCGEAAVDLHVMENNLKARRLYEKSGMSYLKRFDIPEA